MTQTQGIVNRKASLAAGEPEPARARWIAAFSDTLLALRPHWGELRTRGMASDLWHDLSHFDPVLAAEMEYESSLCDS